MSGSCEAYERTSLARVLITSMSHPMVTYVSYQVTCVLLNCAWCENHATCPLYAYSAKDLD
jgi:hypothetical protein